MDGRRFRALTIVDNYSRQCLAIHVDQSIRGGDVVDVVTRICTQRGQTPERIQVDNGSEFGADRRSARQALDRWAYDHGVTLDFSRPGKPTDNPYIESFNGSLLTVTRHECLNVHWFLSLEDARTKIEAWRREYNGYRPHRSLADLPPDEFAENHYAGVADSLLLAG